MHDGLATLHMQKEENKMFRKICVGHSLIPLFCSFDQKVSYIEGNTTLTRVRATVLFSIYRSVMPSQLNCN